MKTFKPLAGLAFVSAVCLSQAVPPQAVPRRAPAAAAIRVAARPQPARAADECTVKPPIVLTADADWAAAEGGARLPFSVTAGLETAVAGLRVRAVGRGTFAGFGASRDLGGPWAAGTSPKFTQTAPAKGAGEGSVEITFEALAADGTIAFTRRTDIFALFEGGSVWGSYSSPTDLKLWKVEEMAAAGKLGEEEFEAGIDSVVHANVAADFAPRDLAELSPGEWKLQRAFEAAAPPESPARAKAAVSKDAVPLTVSGKVEWTDRAGKKHGLPMARVEIRDDELVGSDLITAVTTDAGGNYNASFSFDDGLLQGNPDIFVRVLARSNVADIKPDTAGGTTYAMESPVRNEVASGASLSINLTANNSADNQTVFGLHHSLVVIGTYSGGLAGTMPSQVDVRFPTTRSTSLFDSGVKQLHILRLDRFDWDVVHHEYGHYFQNIHGFQNNPGGSHSFNTHLSSTRGSKSTGVRLSWGEGWPTFFGTSAQNATGSKALAIPDVGDAAYQDTEDATTNLNIETSTGVGEDDEVSVISALWDLYDSAGDGVDESAFSDKFLFKTFKGGAVTTMGGAWEAIAATQTTSAKTDVGGVLGQANIAPVLLTPADNFSAGAAPPAFTWTPNGGGAPNPLNSFRIRFYKSDFSSVVFEKELGNVKTYTPSAADWTTILAGGDVLKWVIDGKSTAAPATPGGTLDRYWSKARTIGGVSIVFVIDDTGSMSEEITAVRNALQAFITAVKARLKPGEKAPVIQLVTFKDNVSTRITSNDLAAVSAAVGALSAGGGDDCPEASAQALKVAVDNIAAGGTILLATDASSQPGVDLGALIARARANGVTVNTILSGDCDGITSRFLLAATDGEDCGCSGPTAPGSPRTDQLAIPAAQPDDGSAALPPVIFLKSGDDPALADGFIQKPGATDPPQTAIVDPGQPPADEAGDTPATALQLIAGEGPVRGIIGLNGDTEDYFAVRLVKGIQYSVTVRLEAGSFASIALFDTDGSTSLKTSSASSTAPRQLLLTPTATGDYFVRVSGSGTTFYLLSVRADAFAGLTSAVEMFSTVSAQTGGAFFVHDEVNSGRTEAYEAALLNVMLSTLGPVVLQANPGELQQGTSISVELIGNGTNWRTGTQVAFPEGGVSVTSVQVLSATRLRAAVTIAGAAPLGFQNVVVTTPLGSATESATGRDLVEIVVANSNPAILSVEPNTLAQGANASVVIRGLNTAWDSTSVLSLGAGITVSRQTIRSATLIEASVTVDAAASIGFRTASVTGAGATSRTRALFVNSGISSLPEIVRATPALGQRGRTLDVTVAGINTHFVAGVTTASFGDGIQMVSATVQGPASVVVRIAIAADAELGFRNIGISTGGETAVLLDGFFVDEVGGDGLRIPLPPGGVARGCLEDGATVTYFFTGLAGKNIEITLRADGRSTFSPHLLLRAPGGRSMLAKTGNPGILLKHVELPESGEYQLVVTDANNRGGCYYLRVRDSREIDPDLVLKLPASGEIRGKLKAGGRKAYSFKAGAGDKFEIKVPEMNRNLVATKIVILDARGREIFRKTLRPGRDGTSLRLPKDGKFRLIVKNGATKSGRFALNTDLAKRRLPPWLRFQAQR